MIFIKGNFDFLKGKYDELFRIIDKMECNVFSNPDIAIIIGGKFIENLTNIILVEENIPKENMLFDNITNLYDYNIITSKLQTEFHQARIIRNKGAHNNPDSQLAYKLCVILFNITVWFYDSYSDDLNFKKPIFNRLLIVKKDEKTNGTFINTNKVINENDSNNRTLKRPFKAYTGDENYIFISYAHKDSNLVFPEIKKFHNECYPIWYDQGLIPGQEWDEEIAKYLSNSSLLVVFISKNSMDSTNVKDEIKFALNKGIDIVPIYLEDTILPLGIDLRLSNKHSIKKYMMENEDYIFECFKAFDKSKIKKIKKDTKNRDDDKY